VAVQRSLPDRGISTRCRDDTAMPSRSRGCRALHIRARDRRRRTVLRTLVLLAWLEADRHVLRRRETNLDESDFDGDIHRADDILIAHARLGGHVDVRLAILRLELRELCLEPL